MNEVANFGSWLKQHRKALNLTQQDLAVLIGCSVVAIKKIESGERKPSQQIAQLLAERLSIPADEWPAFVRFARGELGNDEPDLRRKLLSNVNTRAPWLILHYSQDLSLRPNNLPAQINSFIGREREIVMATSLLRRPQVRLLTLTGPPGIGKSRLAQQVAAYLLDAFKDGVFFVSLAALTNPHLVASAVAQIVGIREVSRRSVLESLKSYLRDKQMLLVLDNFEHVISAASLLIELLEAAPNLKLLVTSRAVLRLYGEHQLQVPPLSMPNLQQLPPVERLGQYEAMRLFIERAVAVELAFTLTDDNARAIAEMSRRLEGIPLAIELAAAHIKSLSPQAMLEHLTSLGGEATFKLLTGGPQNLPARQRTLRKTLDWSYDLLNPDEQTLFRTLSVFTGSFTLQAAREVTERHQSTEAQLLLQITSLIDKSLLRYERPAPDLTPGSRQEGQAQPAQAERSFSMLYVIKEYGLMRLKEHGDLQSAHNKHARYYLQLAQHAEVEFRGAKQEEWFNIIENEHENMLTALRTLEESGSIKAALQLLAVLGYSWYRRGYFASEGLTLMKEALSRAKLADFGEEQDTEAGQEHELSPDMAKARAKVLYAAASIAWRQDDFKTAHLFNEESAAISRRLADKSLLARTLNLSGILALEDSDYNAARLLLEECLTITSEPDSEESALRGTILNNLGQIAWHQGDYSRACSLFERSVVENMQSGKKYSMVHAQNSLGRALTLQGDFTRAQEILERALDLSNEIGNTWGRSVSIRNLGLLALKQGDHARAELLLQESLVIASKLGAKHQVSISLAGLAAAAIGQDGQVETIRAARLLGAVDRMWNAYEGIISPTTRQEYQEVATASRNLLDEATWQKAWSEGQTLSLEQAVSLGLGKLQ